MSNTKDLSKIPDNVAYVSDYTELRAYTGKARSIYVTGYLVTTAPLGIAGLFVRDDIDTSSIDNGGTTIVSSINKRYKRQINDSVSCKWFGAKGDGTSDDTSSILNTFVFCKSSGKSRIYIPSGTYIISSTLPLQNFSGFVLFGDGATYLGAGKGTYLKYIGTSGSLFTIDSCSSFSIQDIWFGYNSSSYSGELVWTDNTAGLDTNSGEFLRCRFGGENLFSSNASNLLRIKKSYQIDVTECLFLWGDIGIGIYSYANIITFKRNQFQNLKTKSAYAYTGALETISFDNNTFEPLISGKAHAFDTAAGVFIFGFNYTKNWHGDIFTAGGLYWINISGGRGVSVSGNTFGDSGGGVNDYAISLGGSTGVQISSNVFYGKSLNFTSASTGLVVSGNTMSNSSIGGYNFVAGNSVWISNSGLNTPSYRSKIYKSANQSIPNNVQTPVTFDGNYFDVGGVHSTSVNNSRFTVPTNGSGLVQISFTFTSGAASSGNVYGFIRKNGGTIIAESQIILNPTYNSIGLVSTIDAAVDGDYYELVILQSSGASLNIVGGAFTAADTNGHLYKIVTLD